MADPTITDTLRAVHARGIIASPVLEGMAIRYTPSTWFRPQVWRVTCVLVVADGAGYAALARGGDRLAV